MSDDDVIASHKTARLPRRRHSPETVQQLLGLKVILRTEAYFLGMSPASATNGKKSMIVQSGKSNLHQYQLVPVPMELMHAKVEEGGGKREEGRG